MPPAGDSVSKLVMLVKAHNPDLAEANPPIVAVSIVLAQLKCLALQVPNGSLGVLRVVDEVSICKPAFEQCVGFSMGIL